VAEAKFIGTFHSFEFLVVSDLIKVFARKVRDSAGELQAFCEI
jgi:hypothetical protein